MSNACETNTNVRNLEFTGTFENEYKSANSYCLRASVPANQTIYILSKDRYDLLKNGSSSSSSSSSPSNNTSKCDSCNIWIILFVVFLILSIILGISTGILTSKVLGKKK